MEAKELLLMSLEHSQGYLAKALDGLTQKEIAWKPKNECNSIAFILWHIARVEDYFVNRVILHGKEMYETDGWQEKLGTPVKAYQYTTEELQAWPVPKLGVLDEYAKSVRTKTLSFINSISNDKLSEMPRPDSSNDSIGTLLCSLSMEVALHVGQIAYLRGVQRGLDT